MEWLGTAISTAILKHEREEKIIHLEYFFSLFQQYKHIQISTSISNKLNLCINIKKVT